MIDAGQQYWEVRFDKESKTFAVGVALRSLGKFDQLGKTGASWCIHLNNWLQQSLTAKHNNKARTLDCTIPNSIGVYINYEEGTVNSSSHTDMHVKKSLLPEIQLYSGCLANNMSLCQGPNLIISLS